MRCRPEGEGDWFLVFGSWFLVLGSWFLVPGSWFLVPLSVVQSRRSSVVSRQSSIVDFSHRPSAGLGVEWGKLEFARGMDGFVR